MSVATEHSDQQDYCAATDGAAHLPTPHISGLASGLAAQLQALMEAQGAAQETPEFKFKEGHPISL
ncbi:MAG: hypothetical protein WCT53_06085, partial [Candidatus Gracilibacteria bacterium]